MSTSFGHDENGDRDRPDRPRIVVYTAIFGGRDILTDPAVLTPGARYVCFTDAPLQSKVWEIVRAPIEAAGPRRTSRWYKLLPHQFFETEYSLWVDGAIRINVDVSMLIGRYLQQADFGAFKHPELDCIFELAERLIRLGLDDPELIHKQVARYRADGLPEHAGLLAGGILLRRHTSAVEQLNEAWWREYSRGSVRDVLSINYCTWRAAMSVALIDGDILHDAEFEFLDHRRQRRRSEFCQAEWTRLVPPASVTTFPADLANTALEYAGVYDDGWLREDAFFGLGQPETASMLVVRGLVPLIGDPCFTTTLHVLVNDVEVADRRLELGDFELRIAPPPGSGRRRVALRFTGVQELPEQVPRQVAALVCFIGFEAAVPVTP